MSVACKVLHFAPLENVGTSGERREGLISRPEYGSRDLITDEQTESSRSQWSVATHIRCILVHERFECMLMIARARNDSLADDFSSSFAFEEAAPHCAFNGDGTDDGGTRDALLRGVTVAILLFN